MVVSKPGFGVGARIVDAVPKMKSVLEPVRGQNVLDHFRSEAMTGSTPERGQAELSIGIHRRSFQKTFFRMEKLANKRVVQSRLPFLNKGKFKAAKIGSASKNRDWGPDEQVLMFAPEAEG